MCGLLGILPKNGYVTQEMVTYFEQLLWVDALRGWNGTGVFRINFQDKTDILKKPGDPSHWFYAKEKEKFSMLGQGLIGHNRATTKGQNIEEHTHPFKENGITLVHNGTITNHNTLGTRDVDSHVICDLLSTGKTPQDLINTLKGFYALIWYNEQTKKLYLLRNEDRPLFILSTPQFLLLTSEIEMGLLILKRNKIHNIKIESVTPYTLYEHTHKADSFKRTQLNKPKSIFQSFHFTNQDTLEQQVKKHYNIKIGSKILVDVIYSEKGKRFLKESWGYLTDDHDIDVSFLDSKLYDGKTVIGTVQSFVTKGNNSHIVIKDVTEHTNKNNTTKDKPDEDGIYVRNGVLLDNKVLQQVWDRSCADCGAGFEYSTKIMLIPLNKNNPSYGYSYVCPKCTEKRLNNIANIRNSK